jgi:hypothetical protein
MTTMYHISRYRNRAEDDIGKRKRNGGFTIIKDDDDSCHLGADGVTHFVFARLCLFVRTFNKRRRMCCP